MSKWTSVGVGVCVERAQAGDFDLLAMELERDPEGVPSEVSTAFASRGTGLGKSLLMLQLVRWQGQLRLEEHAAQTSDPRFAVEVGAALGAQAEVTARELMDDFRQRAGAEPSAEFAYIAGQLGVLTASVTMLMQPEAWLEKVKRGEAPK